MMGKRGDDAVESVAEDKKAITAPAEKTYSIASGTKEMASFVLGINSDKFKELDYDDEMNFLNQAGREGCRFLPNADGRIIGRGNPLLARDEFLFMDEVEKELTGE